MFLLSVNKPLVAKDEVIDNRGMMIDQLFNSTTDQKAEQATLLIVTQLISNMVHQIIYEKTFIILD